MKRLYEQWGRNKLVVRRRKREPADQEGKLLCSSQPDECATCSLHICILHHQLLISILVTLLRSYLWILCTYMLETREVIHLNCIMLSGFQKGSILQVKPLSFVPLPSCQLKKQIFINLPPPPFSLDTVLLCSLIWPWTEICIQRSVCLGLWLQGLWCVSPYPALYLYFNHYH